MADRQEHVGSIANRVADYREGDVEARTPQLIEKWLRQFPEAAQDVVVAEMDHVLGVTYVSRGGLTAFLRELVSHEKFCEGDPPGFWRKTNILDIQGGGNSQREMLALFDELLRQELGLTIGDCGREDGEFVYLDDGVWGGGRVAQDLSEWIEDHAPPTCKIRVVVGILHRGGEYYAKKRIQSAAKQAQKEANVEWWAVKSLENRKYYKDSSDVLWPTVLPPGPLTEAYVHYLEEEEPKYPVQLRKPGSTGTANIFSSDENRIALEQNMLLAGLQIREDCPNLPVSMRPLGATLLKTLGFGSTVATFRNCPNNAPLAWWVGDPWYPLFPRSTNSDAMIRHLLASVRGE